MGATENHYLSVIVVAGGSGNRMKTTERKQFLSLGNQPVLAVTLGVFQAHPAVKEIILVNHPEELERARTEIITPCGLTKVRRQVAGGMHRRDSVEKGLAAVSSETTHVAVHDGARPLITKPLLDQVFNSAFTKGAAILAVPITDTVKRVDAQGNIQETVSRDGLWAAQTPQVFPIEWIRQAYQQLPRHHPSPDDASVVEKAGYPVHLVMGSTENLKITHPEDLFRAARILKDRRDRDADWTGV